MNNGKKYFFAITVVMLTAVAALAQDPQISIDPESYLVSLLEGEQTTRNLTITNDGDAALAYEIWLQNPDPASSDPLIAVSSSPYIDENLQLEATLDELGFDYVYVGSVAEAQTAGADVLMGRFGGAVFDSGELESWVMSGHGYLQLGDWCSWLAIESEATGGQPITVDIVDPNCPLSVDLPSSWEATGFWHYQGSQRLGWLNDISSANVADATVNGETQQRAVTLKRLGNGSVAFIGFNVYGEAAPEESAQLFANALDWVTTGAWSSWLSYDPTEGTVPSGEERVVELIFDATELGGGVYELEVMLSSNDPLNPLLVIPATLQVTGTPVITGTPEALDFGSCLVDSTVTLELDIANEGTDLLLVAEIQVTAPWVGGHAPFSLMPGEHQILEVVFAPVDPAEYDGTLTLLSNDPAQPVYIIPLQGIAGIPPIVSVAATEVYKELYSNSYGEELFGINNTGGAELEVTMLLRGLAPSYDSGPSGDELRELLDSQVPVASSQPPEWVQAYPGRTDLPPADARNITIAVNESDFLAENAQLEATLAEMGYTHFYISSVEEATEAGALAILGRFGGCDLDQDDLTDWIESGHGYIQIGDWVNWYPDTWTVLGGAAVEMDLQDTTHPITSGLPAHWTASGYWEYNRGNFIGWVISDAFHDIADGSANATTYERVVSADQIGDGFSVYLGINVYGENACAESKQLLENALQWVVSGDVVTWVRPLPNAVTVPGGEGFDVTLEFDSEGLSMGEYYAIMTMLTNDPVTPEVEIMIALSVQADETCQPCADIMEIACGETVTGYTDQFCNVSAWQQYECWPELQDGPELVYHFNIAQHSEITVNWSADDELQLFLLTDCIPEACIAAGEGGEFYYDCLMPGDYYLVLDGSLPGGIGFDLTMECATCLTEVVPVEYALQANYPNPFNPATTIDFSLAEPGLVNLVVYNVQGQKVATLLEQRLAAGSHQVQFDGSSLPSGLYLYSLSVGEFTQTRRMLLLK
jgi:hypothetical protein